MKGRKLYFKGLTPIFLFPILVFCLISPVFATEGTLTLSDRDIIERLARLEEGQRGLEQGLNRRIDDLRSELKGDINALGGRIDDLRNLIYVVLAGIFALIGFVIWDRRSAISPVINKTRDMEERERLVLKALREYALKEPRMSEALKSLGLL